MRIDFTLHDPLGRVRDLTLEGDPGLTYAQALSEIVPTMRQLFIGDLPFSTSAFLGSGQLVCGDILRSNPQGDILRWPLASPCLVIRSGPAAGTFLPLFEGKHTLGSAQNNRYHVADPTISGVHVEVSMVGGDLEITDLGSDAGTFVGGGRLVPNQLSRVQPGEQIVIGSTLFSLELARRPDGSVEPSGNGERLFNRVMRYLDTPKPGIVTVPPTYKPQRRGAMLGQYLTSGAMLAVGVASAVLFNQLVYALLGLVTPAVMILSIHLMGRGAKRDEAERVSENAHARQAAKDRIALSATDETRFAQVSTTDPAAACLAALGPTSSLWSVDAADERALLVRLGTTDRPASMEIHGTDGDDEPPLLRSVPVSLDLRTHSVLGIAGEREAVNGAVRAIVLQVAANRSPRDLVVYYLSTDEESDAWSWIRWLPHVRSTVAGIHTVATDATQLQDRLTELSAILDQRQSDRSVGRAANLLHLPEVLVIVDGASSLRTRSTVVRLLEEGPEFGMRFIALERTAARLPVEATARMSLHGPTGALRASGGTVSELIPDALGRPMAERSARAMAPLVPLGGTQDAGLPQSVRLVDLAGLAGAAPSAILSRWAQGNDGNAVVGVDAHGNPLSVNIVKAGPHALVAGSTGSGKSEFLRTWLAGLALSTSPADLSMLLIDFKGGGAFGKLKDLPHVVGYADDLTIGGPLANRLLDSLRAELDHRKASFKNAGNLSSLGEYRRAAAVRSQLQPIARLLIMVDEFAELKEAQPDFVDGLVNVARVGRSLGVHLVLATQQPAGVVTAQIRSNANIRVCLRVLDTATSVDLVGTPVAAKFLNDCRGRAVLATEEGAGSAVFQAAYISGPAPRASGELPPALIRDLPWSQCGNRQMAETRAETKLDDVTDLTDLVQLITQAARLSGIDRARRPWLEPLPGIFPLSALGQPGDRPCVPFAREDNPRGQAQYTLSLELGRGNVGIAGGGASGRSTALRTIAISAASIFSPDDLHLYVIDQSPAPALRSLASLPHCGVVTTRASRYLTERLVSRLLEELVHRSAFVNVRNASSFARASELSGDDRPPHILLLVDGWDSILQDSSQEHIKEALIKVAQDGPALGIQLVVAGGKGVGTPRLSQFFSHLLCLRFDQRDDMRAMGILTNLIPDDLPAGRAYRPDNPNAVQIALIDASSNDGASQSAAVVAIATAMNSANRQPPIVIRELPTRVAFTDVQHCRREAMPQGSVLIGLGGDEALPQVVDLVSLADTFIVGGPARSGRTETLSLLAAQLTRANVPVLLFNAKPSDRDRFPGVRLINSQSEPIPDEAVLLVDDADCLPHNCDVIESAMSRTAPRLVLAGTSDGLAGYGGWKSRLMSAASGLLLSPRVREGDVLGLSIGTDEAFDGPPGRAYMVHRGQKTLVQVPFVGAFAHA